MSLNHIERQATDPRVQRELFEAIFESINENMKLRNPKKVVDAASFPIAFDYKKSSDISKLRLLVHCCLVEIDKLVRNFLSNRTDNPFVGLFERFTDYVKQKVVRLKNQNSDLTTMNLRLRQKTGLLNELCDSVDHILETRMNARDSGLNSEGGPQGACARDERV